MSQLPIIFLMSASGLLRLPSINFSSDQWPVANVPSDRYALATTPVSTGSCDCGEANIVGRIYLGTKVPPHRYPWMVNLKVFQGFAASQCGGTLLDKEHVLTAAHCVYHEGRRKVSPGSIVVYVGADSLNDPYATVVRASRVITFSEYDRENPLSYDIAILRLRSPVDYSDKIRPICLPSTNDEPYSGQKLTVAGWGSIDSRDTRTTNLMEVKVDHLPRNECNAKRLAFAMKSSPIPPEILPYFIDEAVPLPDTDMCAIDKVNGGDACSGDSGGPLMYNNPKNNRWYQVGIVSGAWGRCGESKDIPGLYSQVKSFRNFIRSNSNACFKNY